MRTSRTATVSAFRTAWPWLVLAFLLLGVAMAHPTFRVSRDTYRYLFVLDITQSMNVSDAELDAVPMSRLEFAKAVVEVAFRSLPCGSEAGLAIFTAHRSFVMFTPVEICEHYRAMSDMLGKIDWRMAWAARSEVAKGLYSGLDAARQAENDARLVFLTDGHEAPPLHRSIRPLYRGEPGSVAGFIGGIGGTLPERIPHLNDEGDVVGYWRPDEVMQVDMYSLGRNTSEDGEPLVGVSMANIARRIALGQEHLSSLREQYLRALAEETGLAYVRVDSPSRFLNILLDEKYARRTPINSDLGWIPAALAFVCLAYCFVVRPWSHRSRTGVGERPD